MDKGKKTFASPLRSWRLGVEKIPPQERKVWNEQIVDGKGSRTPSNPSQKNSAFTSAPSAPLRFVQSQKTQPFLCALGALGVSKSSTCPTHHQSPISRHAFMLVYHLRYIILVTNRHG
jgi:hypothetical protein